ncbi:hypothetical protein [Flavobacterium sedimenticola]|uniref:Uncharacterized protein n=1 Tax=Flavobacterium sedimenticola TaxID=3043286 RepID=A0ABT6XS17_9FLAO|nr:hypothetical protein [Flavobacterium sedimenticola]MDI9257888.1 hypothetical protein [Flavobacterium sedimenticola]
MSYKKTIQYFTSNPKYIFLADGFGALISAFLLSSILFKLEKIFGIPGQMLFILTIPPIGFAIYDLGCFLFFKKNYSLKLNIIASGNLAYCLLSLTLAFYYFNPITFWGWIYLLFEILIVSIVAIIELQISKKINRNG